MLRILFVNHTGEFSGAEAAMLNLIRGLPSAVQSAVAAPAGGLLAKRLAERRIEHLVIPGTELSFRLHPRWTAVGLAHLARSSVAIAAHVRRWRPQLVHANGTRAGLLTTALPETRAPVVLQVHDILPDSRAANVVARVLSARATRVVAVSRAAARSFDERHGRAAALAVHIGFDSARFTAHGHDRAAVRETLGIPAGVPLLGEVAQITPWKGQLVAIEALHRLHRTHPDAELVLVGDVSFSGPSVRYDNPAYLRRLHRRVAELGLEDRVHFLGRRPDIPDLMAALDLALLPSWHEPFGTVVAEAMATGTVPLVTDEGGPAELVEDGVTGRVLAPRDPAAWAAAAAELLDDPERRTEMGRRAASSVKHLTEEAYARGMVAVYEEVLAASGTSRLRCASTAASSST